MVGVALLCFVVAFILKWILVYDELNYPECLTIGAIVAATDPVAVALLLKDVGTSIDFSILLEGESHFNDGTSAVFFWVFYNWVKEGTISF